MNTKKLPVYLAELLATIPKDNHFLPHVFGQIEEARQSGVWYARRGNVRKFRHAFMAVGKDIACNGGDGVPFRGHNRRTVGERDYEQYSKMFDTVSQKDAFTYYGVTPKEYDLWMAPWTTFYFYVGRSPLMFAHVTSMDFPSHEVAAEQSGDYPRLIDYDGNSDLWEEDYRSAYDSIDDEPDLTYRILFIGTEPPNKNDELMTLKFEDHPRFTS